jgi:hypothetical protein
MDRFGESRISGMLLGLGQFYVLVGKDTAEDAVDVGCMAAKVIIKLFDIGEPHTPGDKSAPEFVVGDKVSLEAVLHLQHVFETTKKVVRVKKLGSFSIFDKAAVCKAAEADQRVRDAKPFVTAAVSKLQRLSDEFDLANAAFAEFYVKAFGIDVLDVDPLL